MVNSTYEAYSSNCINNIGVLPRTKPLVLNTPSPELTFYYQSNSIAYINTDKNDEYNIPSDILTCSVHGELFDAGIKIIEWNYNAKGQLILEAFTDKQINLFGNLSYKDCHIKTNGPLLVDGKIKVQGNFVVSAESVWIGDQVDCEGTISLTGQQGVGLFAPIEATHLIISAAHVCQNEKLNLSGQLDIAKVDPIGETVNL